MHQRLVKFGWVEEVSEVHVVVGPEPHLPLLSAAEVRQLEVSSEDALPTYWDLIWYLICLDRVGPLQHSSRAELQFAASWLCG